MKAFGVLFNLYFIYYYFGLDSMGPWRWGDNFVHVRIFIILKLSLKNDVSSISYLSFFSVLMLSPNNKYYHCEI